MAFSGRGATRAPGGRRIGLALAVVVAGCAGTGSVPGPSTASTPPPSGVQESVPDVPPMPRGLVGLWMSSGGDAAISYSFEADGSYAHAGFVAQVGTDASAFTFVRQEVGWAVVRGSRISLRPAEAITHSDPDGDRSGSGSLTAREFTWEVSQDVLLLSSGDGGVVRMLRQ
ncbi:hypothetical protein [Umezawaea sp.]|uniref:hypothetical protein n=1 Tax=Umezawaea sp. TaxID=1955258 RepID=UPI002ED641D6